MVLVQITESDVKPKYCPTVILDHPLPNTQNSSELLGSKVFSFFSVPSKSVEWRRLNIMIRRLFFADNEKMFPNAENLKKSTKNVEELNLT